MLTSNELLLKVAVARQEMTAKGASATTVYLHPKGIARLFLHDQADNLIDCDSLNFPGWIFGMKMVPRKDWNVDVDYIQVT